MKIYNYNVDDSLILKYCRVITMLEKGFRSELEQTRAEIHKEIFDVVGLNRSCYTREDRRFSIALMHTVVDLTFEEYVVKR